MAYVAVKGGERAIGNAHAWLAAERRGSEKVPELTAEQIREQMALAVDRVMTEGSCYDRDLAALAIKQARGDLPEAIFMLRAYRTTLPRFGYSEAIDTPAMAVHRRVSAAFKDIPGGQVLGPTFDYTHRLLDFALMADGSEPVTAPEADAVDAQMPTIASVFAHEDLLQEDLRVREEEEPYDLTREPMEFPAGHDQQLQSLARGDEGFLLGLAYSTQRGWGGTHPLCAELRLGEVAVEFEPEAYPGEVFRGTIAFLSPTVDPRSHTEHPETPEEVLRNRLLLREIMREAGFTNYVNEWWHYTLVDEPFPDTYFDLPIEP